MSQTSQATFELLRPIPALAAFSDHDLNLLATVSNLQQYPAGTILFNEGEQIGYLYLISAGLVRLEMLTAKCGQQTILSVGSGDVLAWSALIGNGVMTATAVANENTTLIAFETSPLRQLLEQHTALGYQLMQALAKALSRRLLATRLQLLDLFHS